MRFVGSRSHRESTGKVTVRPRRVRTHAVPQPTDAIRQTAAAHAVAAQRQCAGHRTVVLRAVSRQNAHRDAHTRHAPERRLV